MDTTLPAESIADVRRVPLVRLAAEQDTKTLDWVLPDAAARRVPVAAFNSAL